jgi:hypothetical protein
MDILSKRTSGALLSNLTLKRNQFSVFIGTITHVHPTSGKRRSPKADCTTFEQNAANAAAG